MIAAPPPSGTRRPRMTNLTVPSACGSAKPRNLAMTHRTIGVDLAIRGEHVAQIFDDGRPVGRPLRFRHDSPSLDAFVFSATADGGEQVQLDWQIAPGYYLYRHRVSVKTATLTNSSGLADERRLERRASTDIEVRQPAPGSRFAPPAPGGWRGDGRAGRRIGEAAGRSPDRGRDEPMPAGLPERGRLHLHAG